MTQRTINISYNPPNSIGALLEALGAWLNDWFLVIVILGCGLVVMAWHVKYRRTD